MLKHRLLFGFLMIAALVGLIALDDHLAEALAGDPMPWLLINVQHYAQDGVVVVCVLALLIVLGARELHRLCHAAGSAALFWIPTAVCLWLLVVPFIVRHGLLPNVSADITDDYRISHTTFVGAIGAVFLGVMARRRTAGATAAIGGSILMIVYLGLLPQYLVRLRMCAPSGAAWLLLYTIFVIKVCDIGAYFTGMMLGRHKLIEWLSPKKTIEGLAGGVAASVGAAVGLVAAVKAWAPMRVHHAFPDLRTAAIFGLLAALIGQTGDLVESLFKRDAAAKDSAHAIPAFGGVLDVLDSILLAAPVAYWLLIP